MTAATGWASRGDMEARRLTAAKDIAAGMLLAHVAKKYGVSRTTVCRWVRRLAANDMAARKAPGRPCRLSAEQWKLLATIYKAGPMAYFEGQHTDCWTTASFAEAILTHFEIRYDRDHVGRLMHRLGWKGIWE